MVGTEFGFHEFQPLLKERQRKVLIIGSLMPLGHSTVELTLRVYFHLIPDDDDSLAWMTESLFS